ncbi:N/A [soil metagenome]
MRHPDPLLGSLEAYCRRSLWDRGEVADVLQSAIANAFRDFDLFAEGTNFRAWIFRYVNNEILNANRRAARAPRPLATAGEEPAEEGGQVAMEGPLAEALRDDPDAILDRCDDVLAEAIRDLPTGERAVFLLRSIGEFKYREMAEILGIPIGTVMTHLSRGRGRLRQRLAEFGKEHGLLSNDGAEDEEA